VLQGDPYWKKGIVVRPPYSLPGHPIGTEQVIRVLITEECPVKGEVIQVSVTRVRSPEKAEVSELSMFSEIPSLGEPPRRESDFQRHWQIHGAAVVHAVCNAAHRLTTRLANVKVQYEQLPVQQKNLRHAIALALRDHGFEMLNPYTPGIHSVCVYLRRTSGPFAFACVTICIPGELRTSMRAVDMLRKLLHLNKIRVEEYDLDVKYYRPQDPSSILPAGTRWIDSLTQMYLDTDLQLQAQLSSSQLEAQELLSSQLEAQELLVSQLETEELLSSQVESRVEKRDALNQPLDKQNQDLRAAEAPRAPRSLAAVDRGPPEGSHIAPVRQGPQRQSANPRALVELPSGAPTSLEEAGSHMSYDGYGANPAFAALLPESESQYWSKDGLLRPVLPRELLNAVVQEVDFESRFLSLREAYATVRSAPDPDATRMVCKQLDHGTVHFIKDATYQLGESSQGDVYMALYVSGSVQDVADINPEACFQEVALKLYNTQNSKDIDTVSGVSEKDGIVRIIDQGFSTGSYKEPQTLLVQELGLINVWQLLDRYGESCTSVVRSHIAQATCFAVSNLHSRGDEDEKGAVQGVVHFDLRLPNILIMRDGTLKLCDFGMAKNLAAQSSGNTTDYTWSPGRLQELRAQPYEVSIEIRKRQQALQERGRRALMSDKAQIPQRKAGDIFMLGLVLAQCFTAKMAPPLTDVDILARRPPNVKKLEKSEHLQAPDPRRSLFIHLIVSMLNHDDKRRPTINEVLRHPYFLTWRDIFYRIRGLSQALQQPLQIKEKNTPDDVREFHKVNALLNREIRTVSDLDPAFQILENHPFADVVQNAPAQMSEAFPPRMAMECQILQEGVMVAHPMQRTLASCHWIVSIVEHLRQFEDEQLVSALRDWTGSARVLEFLIVLPKVNWILLGHWERTIAQLQIKRREEREMKDRQKKELQEFVERQEREYRLLDDEIEDLSGDLERRAGSGGRGGGGGGGDVRSF